MDPFGKGRIGGIAVGHQTIALFLFVLDELLETILPVFSLPLTALGVPDKANAFEFGNAFGRQVALFLVARFGEPVEQFPLFPTIVDKLAQTGIFLVANGNEQVACPNFENKKTCECWLVDVCE